MQVLKHALIYFLKDPYAKKFMKDEKFTMTDFIANSGGLLGLCMGFSLVSLAEIVYHCFICIFSLFLKEKEETLDTDSENHQEEGVTEHIDSDPKECESCKDVKSIEEINGNYFKSFMDYETSEMDTFSESMNTPPRVYQLYPQVIPTSQLPCFLHPNTSQLFYVNPNNVGQRHFTSPSSCQDRDGRFHSAS